MSLPTEQEEELRGLISHKQAINRAKTALINRLHALYAHAGHITLKKRNMAARESREAARALLENACASKEQPVKKIRLYRLNKGWEAGLSAFTLRRLVMGNNAPVLDQAALPRKGLQRKSRSKPQGRFVRNWSGKPGFCVPGHAKMRPEAIQKGKRRCPDGRL